MLDISEAKFIELKDLFLKLFTDNINMSNEEVNRFKKYWRIMKSMIIL